MAGVGVVEEEEAEEEVIHTKELKEGHKLRRKSLIKVKSNATVVNKWGTSHRSVLTRLNN